jgi:photosystem II stability/assembly factor-like uncharacterized protein
MRRLWLLAALLAVPAAEGGSRRWTPQGPQGGLATRLYLSPQRNEVWALAQGLLFRNDRSTGRWQFMRLDSAAELVNALAFDPANDQRLYLAALSGRVLRSSDGGANFDVTDRFLVPGIPTAAVAVDPRQPSTVLASVLAEGLGGVFRSTDSGRTWTRVGLEGRAIGSLFIDPDQPGHVYATSGAGAGGDVFLSKDGGLVFQFLGSTGGPTDPRDVDYGQTMARKNAFYAAVLNGVVKSVDGGRRWFSTGLTSPFGDPLSSLSVLRSGEAVLAATLGGLYRSPDGGNVWNFRGTAEGRLYRQSMFDLLPDGPVLYVATRRSGILLTRDLGQSYEDFNRTFFGHRALSMDVDPNRGTLVVGTVAGVGLYRRQGDDRLGRWSPIGSALGLDSPAMVGLLDPQNPNKVYALVRTVGRNGIFASENRGESWADFSLNLRDQSVFIAGIHPSREGPDRLIVGTASGLAQFRQEFNAWLSIFPGAIGGAFELAFDPQRPNRIFYGTSFSLYRSDDGGATVKDLTGPIRSLCRQAPQALPELCVGDPNTVPIPILDLEVDPNNSNRLYVAVSFGGVWVSEQGGDDLRPYFALQDGPGGRILDDVTSIAVHPSRPQEQYFGTTVNGVLRTIGDGQLVPFNENLHYPRVEALAFDRRNPPTLYAQLQLTGVAAYTFGDINEPATFVPGPSRVAALWGAVCVLILGWRRRTGRGAQARPEVTEKCMAGPTQT